MVESWDGRVLGALGDPALTNVTPNIDKFAKKGVLFKHCYTSHPICCPARANLWSGQYTYNCKSWNNHKGLEPGTPILKDVLEEKGGYVFAARSDKKGRAKNIGIGKHDYISGGHSQQNRVTAWTGAANIELPSYLQPKPGVINWKIKKLNKSDWNRVGKAKKFIKKQLKMQQEGKERPFFLYLSLTTPHPRFFTSKYWLSKVDYDAVSIPPKDKELHPVIRYQQISKAWKHGLDPESKKRTRAIYYAMVAETDAFIGKILDLVEKRDLLKDTYVIIVADHGENNMEHDLFYKMNMYESSVRVPLIIAGPGIQQGKIIEKTVSTINVHPTMLDMAGISTEEAAYKIVREFLLPVLKGETDEWRDYAFSMYTGTAANTSIFMIRQDQWKYVAYPGYEPQLFDIIADPDEIKNLAKEHPEIVKKLDTQLRKVCDYEKVHQEWQNYCKESFKKWRKDVKENPVRLFEYGAKNPRAFYDDIMSNTYKGWTDEHAKQLEEWLESE